MSIRVLAGTLALVLCSSAFAADEPLNGPIPDWVVPATFAPGKTGDEQLPVRLLLHDAQYNFKRASQETYVESALRVQTPQGLDAAGTIILRWKPDTDALTVHRLQIQRNGATIDLLARGEKFTVLRREDNLEYATLDGVLTATMQPSGLEVGDILDMAYTIRRADPVLKNYSEEIVATIPNAPLDRVRVRALWDDGDKLRWQATDAIKGAKESRTADGRREWVYTADHVQGVRAPR